MSKDSGHKDGNTKHIGDAIQQLLKAYHIKSRFDEANLVSSWEKMVGKTVAKHTKKVFLRNKVLFVEIDSPSLKHDLNLHKTQIIQLFAKEFGSDVVHEIVIM